MGSAAGLNRVGQRGGEPLLVLTPTSTGTALDSGIQMCEAIGFKTWQFQLIGPGATAAGYSVTMYGTFDQAAYTLFWGPPTGRGSTALPTTSWFVLPGPSDQAGTGVVANPMVSGTSQILTAALGLVAVRAVATIGTAPAPTLPITVVGFAIP